MQLLTKQEIQSEANDLLDNVLDAERLTSLAGKDFHERLFYNYGDGSSYHDDDVESIFEIVHTTIQKALT